MFSLDIKHVSFDAWNTVLIPNPIYSRKRTQLIADFYDVSFLVAKEKYTEIKRHFDDLAEGSGRGFSTVYVYEMLDRKFSDSTSSDRACVLRDSLERLFVENPPLVLPDLIPELRHLVETGKTIGILSNTNFISGRVLREAVFEHMGVHFTTLLFSDEEGMSKPHPKFFRKMAQEAEQKNRKVRSLANILHIGDMLSTDGAQPLPMQSYIINNPYDLVRVLKENDHAK